MKNTRQCLHSVSELSTLEERERERESGGKFVESWLVRVRSPCLLTVSTRSHARLNNRSCQGQRRIYWKVVWTTILIFEEIFFSYIIFDKERSKIISRGKRQELSSPGTRWGNDWLCNEDHHEDQRAHMTHHWLVVIPIIIARPDTQYNNPGTQLDLNHENDGATVNNEVPG